MADWFETWQQLLRDDARGTAWALAAIAAISALELWIPAEPGQSLRGRARNLVYFAQFKLLGLAGLAVWYVWGPPVRGLRLEDIRPAAAALLFVANLVAIDLCYYAYHRAQHRLRPLWALHELHHADAELNATTSYRTYWLEVPVQVVLVGSPTVLLFGGCGRAHGLAVMGFALFCLVFAHSNLRLHLGPLSGWFIGPQVHRIHHSVLPEHQDRNFAQFFPFIDRLFGTWYAPAPGEFPPTGTAELASDAPVWRAMAAPFAIWSGRRARPG